MYKQVESAALEQSHLKSPRVHKFSEEGQVDWDKRVEQLNNGMQELERAVPVHQTKAGCIPCSGLTLRFPGVSVTQTRTALWSSNG